MAWRTLSHKCKYFLSVWAGRIGKKSLPYKVPKFFKAGKSTQTKEMLHKYYSQEVEVNMLSQLFLLNNNSFEHLKVQSWKSTFTKAGKQKILLLEGKKEEKKRKKNVKPTPDSQQSYQDSPKYSRLHKRGSHWPVSFFIVVMFNNISFIPISCPTFRNSSETRGN